MVMIGCGQARHSRRLNLQHETRISLDQELAGPCVEHRRFLFDRSRSCAGSNCPSSQLTLWTCSQTSRPLSLVVPHTGCSKKTAPLF